MGGKFGTIVYTYLQRFCFAFPHYLLQYLRYLFCRDRIIAHTASDSLVQSSITFRIRSLLPLVNASLMKSML
jgi:hypothetical protein